MPETIDKQLRSYVVQFTFRCGLTKEDDKPFFCMCPICELPRVWKNKEKFGDKVLEISCYIFCCLIDWSFLKHEETSKTITSYDIYPKWKDVK